MADFQDKSIIVTGGGSGIGAAAVEILCERGALVTIADLDGAASEKVVAAVAANGRGKAQFVRTDVASEDSAKAMVAAAVAAYGKLDGAINSAGIPPHGKSVHEMSLAEWERGIGVNLRGVFLSIKYEVDAMLKSGGGAIVAISSAAAVMGMLNSGEYCASKSGVTGLVRAAAIDYAKRGVRVNAILPGATDTPLSQRARAQNPTIIGTFSVPMDRRAEPKEIATGAVWLISDEASYVTGACLSIDAGMSIA